MGRFVFSIRKSIRITYLIEEINKKIVLFYIRIFEVKIPELQLITSIKFFEFFNKICHKFQEKYVVLKSMGTRIS